MSLSLRLRVDSAVAADRSSDRSGDDRPARTATHSSGLKALTLTLTVLLTGGLLIAGPGDVPALAAPPPAASMAAPGEVACPVGRQPLLMSLHNVASGLAADVDGEQTGDGALLVAWHSSRTGIPGTAGYAGRDHQRFRVRYVGQAGGECLYTVAAQHSGKCLEIRDGGGAGHPVQQNGCRDVAHQRFTFEMCGPTIIPSKCISDTRGYRLHPAHQPQSCLEQSWDNQPGRWIIASTCGQPAQPRQLWQLITDRCELGRGMFAARLTNWSSRQVAGGSGSGNGSVLVSQSPSGALGQQLRVEHVDEPGVACQYRIVDQVSSRCADVKDAGGAGSPLHLWDCLDVTNQRYAFVHEGNGRYSVKPVHRPDLCVEQSWDDREGRWLIVAACTGQDRQSWMFTSAPETGPVRVTTFNVCGNASHCPDRDDPRYKADVILREVTETRPADVVLLQEVCAEHVQLLREALPGWGIHQASFSKTPDETEATCSGGKGRYGTAVLYRGGWMYDQVIELPWPSLSGKEIRRMMCSQPVNQPLARNTRQTAFCSVHLSTKEDEGTDGTLRARQVDRVRAEVDSYLSMNYRLILGGDFNLFPPGHDVIGRMSPLYQASVECDARDSAPTTEGGKIDYIFGFGSGVAVGDCTPYVSSTSDHSVLHGDVTY